MGAIDIAPTLHLMEPGPNGEESITVMDEYIAPQLCSPRGAGAKVFAASAQCAVARLQAGL